MEYNERIENLAQQSISADGVAEADQGCRHADRTDRSCCRWKSRIASARAATGRAIGGCSRDVRNSVKASSRCRSARKAILLRTLLVQGAQHILGPFGPDCDLRRWGLKLAERGGRNGKKRAIVATARKLAVLLHHLWVSGEVYEPLHNSSQASDAGRCIKSKSSAKGKAKAQKAEFR